MRVLLSEAASLTAREHLTVLGPRGVAVDVAATRPLSIARFSRWCGHAVRVPASGTDPLGYLDAVAAALRRTSYDALLPTHEQAWLFAVGRHRLPADAPLAVSSAEAFDAIQGKIACARLFDAVGVPQPPWTIVADEAAAARGPFPCWFKAPFSTAGRGVRAVPSAAAAVRAYRELAAGGPLLAQQPATGRYAQVAGLFAHGRLVAVHASEAIGVGAGGSAAARIGVDHPLARDAIERVGRHLAWHGGLTLDYLHVDGRPQFIEANPRTVEPANAAASGVDLPGLTISLGRGDALPAEPVVGRPGIRTHGALALMLGAAERSGTRRAALRALGAAVTTRGSREVLSPPADPLALAPLVVVAARLMRDPGRAAAIAGAAVGDYAVPPSAVQAVAATR